VWFVYRKSGARVLKSKIAGNGVRVGGDLAHFWSIVENADGARPTGDGDLGRGYMHSMEY
jgi:hypothetical protein